MDLLAFLLVGHPLHILAVALVFLAGYGFLQASGGSHRRPTRPLLIASLAWLGYASWEWLILVRTPEANIRVDLLLIWPALALLSTWAAVRLLIG
jgi:hypothetical protein